MTKRQIIKHLVDKRAVKRSLIAPMRKFGNWAKIADIVREFNLRYNKFAYEIDQYCDKFTGGVDVVITEEMMQCTTYWQLSEMWLQYEPASNILKFRSLWIDTINEIWAKNTKLLVIEYCRRRTGLPTKKIDQLLNDYTMTEIISNKQMFNIDKKEASSLKNCMINYESSYV